ncbi:MAG: SEC-C metal-binding domain-containing protein [Candidatus Parabeggiatoa sp.]|nr:SEC-C metal-binding domain-containing protein [Candidatus Parabeggiatoa sp.]
MGRKIGRNDPCWCGSGKKYKKCHLNRHEQERAKPWEAIKGLKEAFSSKYCSVPKELKAECNGKIIKAHTVSKSQNLSKIANNNHVYALNPTLQNFDKFNGKLHPELVGINKASTFTGFCGYHDKAIFAPLEDKPFAGSKEQCFLLAYRALSRENFAKKSSLNIPDLLKKADSGHDIDTQIFIQNIASSNQLGIDTGNTDIDHHQKILDEILLTKDFTKVKSHIIYFSKTPNVMCSSVFFPTCDFSGNKLFDLRNRDQRPDLMTTSVIATNKGGAIVFCWIHDDNSKQYNEKFIESLKKIPKEKLTSSIILFFFEFFENIFIAPAWWDKLAIEKKEELIDRCIRVDYFGERRPIDCLCNSDTFFDNWLYVESMDL